jgi:hypothetical protein
VDTIAAVSERKGKSVVLGSAVIALIVLLAGGVALKDWIREEWYLSRLFEPLGRNAQGLREFRHRESGIVFVKAPGAESYVSNIGLRVVVDLRRRR